MKYEPKIKVNKLIPSMGEYKYFAEVDIYEIGKASNGPIQHNLGEVYGKTENEARENINEKYKKWFEENK